MGKLLSDSTTIAEPFQGSPPVVLPWRDPKSEVDACELRRRTVTRLSEDLRSVRFVEREAIDDAIRHIYSPNLKNGWGIHVVQAVKLLAKKEDPLLEWFCDGEEDEIESHKRVLVRRLIYASPKRREDEVGVGEEEEGEKVSTQLRSTVPHVIKCQLTMPQGKKFNVVYDN